MTFNANGGSGTMSPQIANVPTALTLNTFTRSGYTLQRLEHPADGSGTSHADGATYDFTADITLYAQWSTLPNHTVTFDNNGGSGSMSPQTANVPAALTTNTFTRAGYTFSGWNTAANGSGTTYADGATYSFSADITLYAQWTAICYALTLGHTGNGTTPTATPAKSTACATNGQYVYGENISLTGATAATGWGIASWTGTTNDGSTANTNSVSMPASAHSAGVNYLRLLGDVDSDGAVNSTDALIVLSADAGLNTSSVLSDELRRCECVMGW